MGGDGNKNIDATYLVVLDHCPERGFLDAQGYNSVILFLNAVVESSAGGLCAARRLFV